MWDGYDLPIILSHLLPEEPAAQGRSHWDRVPLSGGVNPTPNTFLLGDYSLDSGFYKIPVLKFHFKPEKPHRKHLMR